MFEPVSTPAQKLYAAAAAKQTAGDDVEAQRLYKEVIALEPGNHLASFNLGILALGRASFGEAASLFMAAWDAQPSHVESAVNLVYSLQSAERFDDMKMLYPKFVSVAAQLFAKDDATAAMRISELLISLDTGFSLPDPHWIRGNCLMALRRAKEALEQFNGVIRLWPQYGLSCLGNISAVQWQLLGDADLATQTARRQLSSAPKGSAFEINALESLLKTMPFHAASSFTDLKEMAQRHQRLASANRQPTRMAPIKDPAGKLRVAFLIDKSVSSGASRGVWELLRRLPDHNIEPAIHDLTGAVSSGGLQGQSPEEAAATLRALGYDVVIDATDPAQTAPPGLFDYRVAPVQLAYPQRIYPPASEQIDGAFVTPEMIDVEGAADAMRWLTLPGPFHCAEPIANAPDVVPCPSESAGFVTFGLIAQPGATGLSALDALASVLGAVKDSRLLIVNDVADSKDYQERILARLAQDGVQADRVAFTHAVAQGDLLAALARIDIVLDSFPTPGFGTIDAAWQGVMSIGYGAGNHPIARRAIATFKALGFSDLIAEDRDAYFTLAVGLAKDAERRKAFRASARATLASSPALSSAEFARGFAEALRAGCMAK